MAKARMEEMRWYEKFDAFGGVIDETCVLRTGHRPMSCLCMITTSCASLWECPIPLAMTARSRIGRRGILQRRRAEVTIGPCSFVLCVCMHVAHFLFTPRDTEHL